MRAGASSRSIPVRIVAVVAAVAVVTVPVLAAFSYPLSSEAIREAYFLGNRNDEQTADFLAKYTHTFPQPKSGPYVEEIGIETPFTQIVRHAKITPGYNAPDAVQEFQGKPLPFRVHVDIMLTSNYAPIPPESDTGEYQWVPDFWDDFKVHLLQNGNEIPSTVRRGGPLYAYGGNELPYVTGARVQVDYDPEKIQSEPLAIIVVTPGHGRVETTFELGRLR